MATRFKHWFYFRGLLWEYVKLTKNADPDKFSYNDFGIGFDTRGEYFWPYGSVGKSSIIFRVDMS